MIKTKATPITRNSRYEAYSDCMGRHFVYDNKLSCTFGRYKTKSLALKEAKEMNKCNDEDSRCE